ncbi:MULTISPECIES: glycine cleavage system protein R [unclassified Pseudoalteromonas]|jgi:glycine cleavage system transcriptional repressor|uniref:glycine cleavage system protein R n=1 Tax=unclassified Pseudoalteromonas TaxID=194690 RepID=UPI0005A8A7E3|nr:MULTISPECIES: ACT domain-containing protein [unclassified Pseudoalteromonas]MBU2968974.1 glycine cleavage system transcriptional repressor [Pseudoalteromonas sp. C2R02]
MPGFSNQQLVLTAIGDDRTGIVAELTQLVSECSCNIIDSRIAILGNEFSIIMLLSGDMSAISRIEHTIPVKSMEMGLLTMMKRTTNRTGCDFCAGYTLEYKGIDTEGTLSKVTSFLAEDNIDICSLKSDTYEQDNQLHMCSTLEINVEVETSLDSFKLKFERLCTELNLESILRRIR